MKTLVYLGCNQGDSLFRLLNFNFDKIFARFCSLNSDLLNFLSKKCQI